MENEKLMRRKGHFSFHCGFKNKYVLHSSIIMCVQFTHVRFNLNVRFLYSTHCRLWRDVGVLLVSVILP